MSLKAFHLFFIALSVVLSVGLGGWGVSSYMSRGGADALGLGVVFFSVGFVRLVYGRRFLRKMKEIEG